MMDGAGVNLIFLPTRNAHNGASSRLVYFTLGPPWTLYSFISFMYVWQYNVPYIPFHLSLFAVSLSFQIIVLNLSFSKNDIVRSSPTWKPYLFFPHLRELPTFTPHTQFLPLYFAHSALTSIFTLPFLTSIYPLSFFSSFLFDKCSSFSYFYPTKISRYSPGGGGVYGNFQYILPCI